MVLARDVVRRVHSFLIFILHHRGGDPSVFSFNGLRAEGANVSIYMGGVAVGKGAISSILFSCL